MASKSAPKRKAARGGRPSDPADPLVPVSGEHVEAVLRARGLSLAAASTALAEQGVRISGPSLHDIVIGKTKSTRRSVRDALSGLVGGAIKGEWLSGISGTVRSSPWLLDMMIWQSRVESLELQDETRDVWNVLSLLPGGVLDATLRLFSAELTDPDNESRIEIPEGFQAASASSYRAWTQWFDASIALVGKDATRGQLLARVEEIATRFAVGAHHPFYNPTRPCAPTLRK